MTEGPALTLDRMAIEEVGANPEKLAAAIHAQLNWPGGPVPVHSIARALDIVEIREVPLVNLEGALLTTPERAEGKILVNSKSTPERRRYSLSHELGHFLIQTHVAGATDGFHCSGSDMAAPRGDPRHQRQEREANRFAIELLAPLSLLRPVLKATPDLSQVLKVARELKISREAAARRYVELHLETLAVVFSRNGTVLYTSRGREFPTMSVDRGSSLPVAALGGAAGTLSDMDEAPSDDWLRRPAGAQLWAQTLAQQDGYAITLLQVEEPDEDDGALEGVDFPRLR